MGKVLFCNSTYLEKIVAAKEVFLEKPRLVAKLKVFKEKLNPHLFSQIFHKLYL